MSSGGPRNPGKGGSNKMKPARSEARPEKPDLNPKPQIKPTAEQMQLAKIIDSHRVEDPELREKIKTVMEVTRVSEDEACMALHSRDYDTAQAITLLTDGENLAVEWEQAGKKKKPKAPTPKNELPRGRDSRDRSEKRGEKLDKLDSDHIENAMGGDRRGERGERGGRGMGRGRGGRGGRGGISRVENKENDEVSKGGVGRIANGPPRGGRGGIGRGRGAVRGGSDPARTFASRARGREDDPNNSIGMWVAETPANKERPPMKVGEWNNGFPSAEDWDNEEYTGSLQETKVFTASNAPPLMDQANGVDNSISTAGAGDALTDPGVSSLNNVAGAPGNLVSGQSLDLSMLLPKPPNASAAAGNPGADILASLQSSYATGNQGNVVTTQALPPRHKVQRPPGPKIPSSAVEMPVDPVTGLDIKFGDAINFDDSTRALSFGPDIHGTNAKPDMLYNSAAAGIDAYSSNAKDAVPKGAPAPAPSPFHNQRNTPAVSDTSVANAISGNMDPVSLQAQKNVSPQSYGTAQGGSAFANYPKGVPGYTTVAPGFPPVGVPGTATYNNSSVGNGSPGVTATSYSGNSSTYHHSMGSMPYGTNAPVVSAVPAQAGQPMLSQSSYSGPQPPSGYNTAAPSNYSNQYGNYGSKIQSSLGSQSGNEQSGDSNSAPASASTGSNLGMSSMQNSAGLPSTSSANPKISAASNMTGGTSGAKMNIPPGMMMPPQYILNPAQTYYQVQAPFYGFDENMQIPMRVSTQFPGYYDTSASNYAPGAGGPGVAGRNDGTTMPGYSSGTDARFPRSDSSTASPVPSNLPGQSAQQPIYNHAAMPGYYFLGNNMMHPGYQYPPPPPPAYLHPTSAIVTSTNPTGAAHTGSANHQYQKKGGGGQLYGQQYGYDGTQQGTDYGKNSSYSGGPGQNSSGGKSTSATSSGSSQSTDLNSSMYSKGQLGKMNSYDKPYGGGGYNSMGTGSNPLTSPLSGAGMGGHSGQYYVQQDGTSGSRQGVGQQGSNKQYAGGPYWGN